MHVLNIHADKQISAVAVCEFIYTLLIDRWEHLTVTVEKIASLIRTDLFFFTIFRWESDCLCCTLFVPHRLICFFLVFANSIFLKPWPNTILYIREWNHDKWRNNFTLFDRLSCVKWFMGPGGRVCCFIIVLLGGRIGQCLRECVRVCCKIKQRASPDERRHLGIP